MNNNTNNDIQTNNLKHVSTNNLQQNSKSLVQNEYIEQMQKPIENIVNNTHNNIYRISRLNIDSIHRNTIPKNIISNNNISTVNPFILTKNSTIIKIRVNMQDITNKISINDKIIISNVIGDEFFLNKFEFIGNTTFIKIYHNSHNMTPFDTKLTYLPYQIKIENISTTNTTFLQNVPINLLNNYHQIYFNIDNSNHYNADYYYINIPIVILKTKIYNINFKVIYNHLYGIPLSYLNANYPIDIDNSNGYHIISSIDNDIISIETKYIANASIMYCGGEQININKIIDFIDGYPEQNNYKIQLNKTYYNVNKIKLVSTEFPNSDKIIKNIPSSQQNNLLYWQILNDGEYIYNIQLTPGNYNIANLIIELKTRIESVERINKNFIDTFKYTYSTKFDTNININSNTNVFDISFFSHITIENPLKIINSSVNNNSYYLEVFHPNHLLRSGTTIIIQNAIDTGIVSADIINTSHIIDSIIDENNYIIKLPRFNPITITNSNTDGGSIVKIIYPLLSRLLFDRTGTIGSILGFRNVSRYNSITDWNYTNKNNTVYFNDLLVNELGVAIDVNNINNYINLSGYNYILMTCSLFKNTGITGSINNNFAKLLLSSSPGSVLFNQFIQLCEDLDPVELSVSELEFAFYSPDGSLYNFYGLNHSFTIEIYETIINSNFINKNSKLDHIIPL